MPKKHKKTVKTLTKKEYKHALSYVYDKLVYLAEHLEGLPCSESKCIGCETDLDYAREYLADIVFQVRKIEKRLKKTKKTKKKL